MKKGITALLALAICASTTAFAAEQSGSTVFTCEVANEPTYSISIPASATLTKEGTPITLQAKNVSGLNANQRISVTLEGTDAFRNQMLLKGADKGYYVRYQIITASGETLETTGDGAPVLGKELVSFTEDGSASYTAKLLPSFADRPDSYSGTIEYGIGVMEA